MALRLSSSCTRTTPIVRQLVAKYHDYIRAPTPGGKGSYRIPLHSSKIIGVGNDRGTRGHQEDYYAYATLSIKPEELQQNLKKYHKIDWDPHAAGDQFADQLTFVGIYDGHGGSAVSQFLRQELHGIFESVQREDIPELAGWTKELGGYFKRWKGGVLSPWIHDVHTSHFYDMEARATQAFLEVDRHMSIERETQSCGATASVALIQSLDTPHVPFFAANKVALTVAHCGDTRVLLGSTEGAVFTMTEKHHADARVESTRLRRMMGSSLVSDSFGESRWMGVLENTRGLGDLRFKKFGVTAEPEVRTKLLDGSRWAYIILVSDGVSSLVSDAEIVDLVRTGKDPKDAADKVLEFVDALGGEDNATILVVPLAGWGKVEGPDRTKELREYRREEAEGSERHRRM
ncbi:protein serine/threonine phosphatase 2C [Cylindrobasidium torrendii FP15055 ss-10]|uniref:Protein serine/threonine phosphatase 2C n=1 Tax=Cylindrobasidium torrendii FP15055 ss-10 TaxID=1314674 RepID=A0A0D7B0R1_9AGAR|nr:protein serine/threonine phosphatase 2C [Cylindrobasidium torrendii FP15055 ss-10]